MKELKESTVYCGSDLRRESIQEVGTACGVRAETQDVRLQIVFCKANFLCLISTQDSG